MLSKGSRRALRRARTPLGLLLAAAGLGVLARAGVLDPFDRAVAELARPGESWGDLQMQVDPVVEGLRPAVAAGAALAASAVAAVRDRTPRPLAAAAAALVTAGGLTWLLQGALGRPDLHGPLAGFDGSYPSGHTVTVAVAAALVLRALVPRRPRWGVTAACAAGLVMGAALVLQVAHWATDVVGGLLLAAGVLGLLALADPPRDAVTAGSD